MYKAIKNYKKTEKFFYFPSVLLNNENQEKLHKIRSGSDK